MSYDKCIDSASVDNVSSGLQYTFIAQLVGRREDLSHPENSCRPRETWIF